MTLTIDISSFLKGAVGLIFAVLALGILVMLVARVRRWFASREFARQDIAQMRRRWREIENLAADAGEMSRKMALVEADKLLDQALKSLTMPGNTLGERLKFAAYKYPELQSVWWAHRMRNQLVHEATFHLDLGLARKAIHVYQQALRRLGAI